MRVEVIETNRVVEVYTSGPPGQQGIQGQPGEQGQQGDPGIQGNTGPPGVGLTWRGAWNSSNAYDILHVVTYLNDLYIATDIITSGILTTPDVSADWDLMIQGP